MADRGKRRPAHRKEVVLINSHAPRPPHVERDREHLAQSCTRRFDGRRVGQAADPPQASDCPGEVKDAPTKPADPDDEWVGPWARQKMRLREAIAQAKREHLAAKSRDSTVSVSAARWPNQRNRRRGPQFIQEDSSDEIGSAIADFVRGSRRCSATAPQTSSPRGSPTPPSNRRQIPFRQRLPSFFATVVFSEPPCRSRRHRIERRSRMALPAVEAQLTYLAPGEGPVQVRIYPPAAGSPPCARLRTSTWCRSTTRVRSRDSLRLDEQGFELHSARTAFADFYDEAAVRERYYPEVQRLCARSRARSTSIAFDHNVRSAARAARGETGVRVPVDQVHNDYTEHSGPNASARFSRLPAAPIWRIGTSLL